jgi:formate hydrogenlyase regulatory protein HycA
MARPDLLRIPYEDWEDARFEFVGRYAGDYQFMAFVTGAYPADWSNGKYPPQYYQANWAKFKRWYAVLNRFDAGGNHLGTDVYSGGTTEQGEVDAIERADAKLVKMLESLGPRDPCDIWVKPYRVEIEGYVFGLLYELNNCDDPADPSATFECVMLQPNDLMFHPPWDSGEYST